MTDAVPNPSRCYRTTLIPIQETVSWKIHQVSELLQTNTWSAMNIPLEVGLGATELSRWNIALVARNENKVLCLRAMLLSPQELHRRVTHLIKVAVVEDKDGEKSAVYHFPNHTNSNSRNANIRGVNRNNDNENNRCMKNLRRLFLKNAKLDVDDELGDGTKAKEVKPGNKGPPSLWKVIPIDQITPDEDDCIELRVTLTVFGCDSTIQ